MDAHEVTPQLDVHAHHAIGIFTVPVSNRIAEGFGEGGAEIEADAARGQRTGGKVSGDQFDGVAHHPKIARDVEPHRARRHIKSQAQNAASASSAVRVMANNVSSLVSSNSVWRSAVKSASRSCPPCSRIL